MKSADGHIGTGEVSAETPQFNIQVGDTLTWNVKPILHEVRHALKRLLEDGVGATIDLRSIPLAPGEEQTILDKLGTGEVQARLQALGPSEIVETACSGVWLVTHYNDNEEIISRFIEITEMPDILRSQRDDMVIALERLGDDLGDELTVSEDPSIEETDR